MSYSMSEKADEQRELIDRARHAWAIMSESEKSAVRIGLIPRWTMLEDFGGKAGRLKACWLEITTTEELRLFQAALFECAGREEMF